jgi:hypothetical protein
MSDLLELDANEEQRAAILHEESLVIDTLGLGGPTVIPTTEILQRIDEMLDEARSTSEILEEVTQLTQRAVIEDRLPAFWQGWDSSGVDVSSTTVGSYGERPFAYQNAIRDLAHWTHSFITTVPESGAGSSRASRKERGQTRHHYEPSKHDLYR